MDPTTHSLKQVNIEDAAEADRIFAILMGERVEPRREFIKTYDDGVRYLVNHYQMLSASETSSTSEVSETGV